MNIYWKKIDFIIIIIFLMSVVNGHAILRVYEIINYIDRYIKHNVGVNFAYFAYFPYPNIIDVISNQLRGIIINDVIIINNYYIYIIQNVNIYEIYIVENELIVPKGPI
jgi:nitrate reductase gamma subunit